MSPQTMTTPNAAGERRATDDHPDEREKIYAVASQLDWFVRQGIVLRMTLTPVLRPRLQFCRVGTQILPHL
jgi:hypothetical protein